ncbi:hypothetical protein AAEO56_05340 [Flavobacterium sp. DGU11]|uniref:Uncharacterized protein n=1 Tax=Flavobacterium arundinis TaxID=3139143 RepID=A0ABU9HU34_9FLAO
MRISVANANFLFERMREGWRWNPAEARSRYSRQPGHSKGRNREVARPKKLTG